MHIIRILRDYLGLTQTEIAKRSGLTHADVNEMENKAVYGHITKYQRLAKTLNTTVHSLVMNDPNNVPSSFFDQPRSINYANEPLSKRMHLGRQGEELVLKMETMKLEKVSPTLSKLVLPYYKMKGPRPGFDILSFNENGTPVCIEVKTSEQDDSIGFQLTKNEHDSARKLVDKGYTYLIYHFSYWGTPKKKMSIYNFEQMLSDDRITPAKYVCNVKQKPEYVSGIVYYREKMGISQNELAAITNIPATSLCKYEQGQTISADACVKLSKYLDVSIDDLLKEYPTNSYLN